MCHFHTIVDTGVPRGVATSTSLEFGTSKEGKEKVNLAFPEVLILLLRGEVLASWFRRGLGKPAGNVCQGCGQSDASFALGSLLRCSKYCLGVIEGSRGVRKMDDGQRVPCQEHIECKGAIERLVPGSDTTGNNSAHRQCSGKTIGEQLNQASRDDSA